jgi:hypothetical protein
MTPLLLSCCSYDEDYNGRWMKEKKVLGKLSLLTPQWKNKISEYFLRLSLDFSAIKSRLKSMEILKWTRSLVKINYFPYKIH